MWGEIASWVGKNFDKVIQGVNAVGSLIGKLKSNKETDAVVAAPESTEASAAPETTTKTVAPTQKAVALTVDQEEAKEEKADMAEALSGLSGKVKKQAQAALKAALKDGLSQEEKDSLADLRDALNDFKKSGQGIDTNEGNTIAGLVANVKSTAKEQSQDARAGR